VPNHELKLTYLLFQLTAQLLGEGDMSCLRHNVCVRQSALGLCSGSRRALLSSRPLARPLAQGQRCCPLRAFKPGREDDTLLSGLRTLTQRYDFLSSGCGALCVTTFFVLRGQEPGQALMITAVSSVMALVLNELLFNPPTK